MTLRIPGNLTITNTPNTFSGSWNDVCLQAGLLSVEKMKFSPFLVHHTRQHNCCIAAASSYSPRCCRTAVPLQQIPSQVNMCNAYVLCGELPSKEKERCLMKTSTCIDIEVKMTYQPCKWQNRSCYGLPMPCTDILFMFKLSFTIITGANRSESDNCCSLDHVECEE